MTWEKIWREELEGTVDSLKQRYRLNAMQRGKKAVCSVVTHSYMLSLSLTYTIFSPCCVLVEMIAILFRNFLFEAFWSRKMFFFFTFWLCSSLTSYLFSYLPLSVSFVTLARVYMIKLYIPSWIRRRRRRQKKIWRRRNFIRL